MLLARQRSIICILVIQETNLNVIYNPSLLFKPNNSKHNKNIISFAGLFIIGVSFYIGFGFNILVRQGWITELQTELHGSMDLFIHCCYLPVVLPTIYFMRNPKHLISVLQDHNLTISPNLATLNKNEQSRQRVWNLGGNHK